MEILAKIKAKQTAIAESFSLENLYREVEQEMEDYHYPSIDITNYYREYGKAIAIVRTVYQIPIEAIDGLTTLEVLDIESGRLYPRASNLCCYSKAIGITLDDFLAKVAANVEVLKVFEAIA